MTKSVQDKLFILLDKAEQLAAEFSGGYASMFDHAEDFHRALFMAIRQLKAGDNTQLAIIHFWFLPTSAWDTFTGTHGQALANEITALLTPVVNAR